MSQPIWTPSSERIQHANMTAFMRYVSERWNEPIADYDSLYTWSIKSLHNFWVSIWQFCGVIAETQGEVILENPDDMEKARFFPQARLNYAENLLQGNDE